ncbi:unnamed protein product [Trichogramma brassicae]|uniref:Secreted protein n=1 Tax=Trichogramma brassicae TaxID=86971 RepID=A0A6H5I868_9HYME|nr:unnamed protein product [Trichogramma brassicae]
MTSSVRVVAARKNLALPLLLLYACRARAQASFALVRINERSCGRTRESRAPRVELIVVRFLAVVAPSHQLLQGGGQ